MSRKNLTASGASPARQLLEVIDAGRSPPAKLAHVTTRAREEFWGRKADHDPHRVGVRQAFRLLHAQCERQLGNAIGN